MMAHDHVKIFYYRDDHQTIKTYKTELYTCLTLQYPDPSPTLHCNAYQCGIALTHLYPPSYIPDSQPTFNLVIPVLDTTHMLASLDMPGQHLLNDCELENIGWEYPKNGMLEYSPAFLTTLTRQRGYCFWHPMIGDLDDLFQNGLKGMYVKWRPDDLPPLFVGGMQVRHNIALLAKWTDEMMALHPYFN